MPESNQIQQDLAHVSGRVDALDQAMQTMSGLMDKLERRVENGQRDLEMKIEAGQKALFAKIDDLQASRRPAWKDLVVIVSVVVTAFTGIAGYVNMRLENSQEVMRRERLEFAIGWENQRADLDAIEQVKARERRSRQLREY